MSNGDPFDYQLPGLAPLEDGKRPLPVPALPDLGPGLPGNGKGGGMPTIPAGLSCFRIVPSDVSARYQQYPQTSVGNDLISLLPLPFTRNEVIRAVKNVFWAAKTPARFPGDCSRKISATDFHVASAVRDILNTRVCRGWLKFSRPPRAGKDVMHLGEQIQKLVSTMPLPGVGTQPYDSQILDLDFVGTTLDDSRRPQPVGPGHPSGPLAPGTMPQGPGQPSIGPIMAPGLPLPGAGVDVQVAPSDVDTAPGAYPGAAPALLAGQGPAFPALAQIGDGFGPNLSNLQAANFFPIHNAYSIKGED